MEAAPFFIGFDAEVSNIMVRSVEYGGIVLVDYGFGNFSFKMDVPLSVY